MSASVKLQVHEGEPGVAVVLFVIPPQGDEERYSYLQRTLEQWSKAHPHFQIQDVQTLRRAKRPYGLAVFFKRKKTSLTLNVKVEPQLTKRYGGEYIEAITADAAGLLSDSRLTQDFVVMINRRQIAIFLEWRKQEATIVSLEKVRQRLSEQQETEFSQWLEGGEFGYFVAPIAKPPPSFE